MLQQKWLKLTLALSIFFLPLQAIHSLSSATPMSVYYPGLAGVDCYEKPKSRFLGLCGSTSPVIFGATANQSQQTNAPGYTTALGGGGLLVEFDLYKFFRLGFALSGFYMQIKPLNTPTSINQITKVYGGAPAIYGGISYAGAFVYLTAATGVLKYTTSRTIPSPAAGFPPLPGAGQTATGRFEARQNSYRIRGGWAIPLIGTLEVTPMASVDNVVLKRGTYTEIGAGAGNLTVRNGEVSASQTAFGVRFAEISEPEIFYPEVHYFSFSDAKPDRLKVISRFLDGIPPIVLEGITPSAQGYNVGGSITTNIFGRNMLVTASYDYETRQRNFTSHAFYIRVRAFF